MEILIKWCGLQLFGGEGAGDGGGDGAAAAGDAAANTVAAPDAGENRLRELGVPESVLERRAKRGIRNEAPAKVTEAPAQQAASAEEETPEGAEDKARPQKQSFDELMKDPEYNQRMQEIVQSRLKTAKAAEEQLQKLAPAIELICRKYGLDANNLDMDALNEKINDDDDYYEDKALEMGIPIEAAKRIDRQERETARRKAEDERTAQQQMIANHLDSLRQQGEKMKETFRDFDLDRELQNPAFFRMTSPNIGLSVEDAYYAVHRKEIQTAAMKVTAEKTAQAMANSIRSGQSRPVENGSTAQAPSVTSFDYAHASREQREARKAELRARWARGEKVYPGQL